MRISMKNGIEIEPMKIGWLQLLFAAAVVGGYGVTLSTVVMNQAESTEATQKLNETMIEVNNTLTAMKIENGHDRSDIASLKEASKKHDNDIIELQIVTGIRK